MEQSFDPDAGQQRTTEMVDGRMPPHPEPVAGASAESGWWSSLGDVIAGAIEFFAWW